MLILADKCIPNAAKGKVSGFGEVIYIATGGITYNAISGHPDIFFCKTENDMVIAPNLPVSIMEKILKQGFSIKKGTNKVGSKYPETAFYNAVVTDKFLIHNLKHTDPTILENCSHLDKINVNQSYTRCNLLAIKNDRFITSDKGIEKTLTKQGLEVLFINPKGILLPGFDHGFIGGCCGIFKNQVFFIGSLNHFPEGNKVRNFLKDYEIIELYDGPLIDGGSLIFIS